MVNWKVIAILFGVLLIVAGYYFYIGVEDNIHTDYCASNICGTGQYDAWTYDNGICNCWEDNIIKYQIPIK